MNSASRCARVAFIALALASAHLVAAATVVQQPRGYGHVVGDVLVQRVSLDGGNGRAETPVMPPTARVNAWFDRLPSRIEVDSQGQTWLRLDYQVINAPRDLVLAALPSFEVATKSGKTLTVPEWPVSIGPLTPDVVYERGDLQALRPDVLASAYPTHEAWRTVLGWVALLALTLLAWGGWFVWRNLRDASRLPFARAARDVQRLARAGRLEGTDGWVSVHRAFNDAAGRVVQAESLPALFARVPYLIPMKPDIERFYAASSERFFSRAPASASGVQLDELSRRLRQAEKRGGSAGA